MTLTLRKQLSVLCGIAVFGGALLWNNGALWAQDDDDDTSSGPRLKLSREDSAKWFAILMESEEGHRDLNDDPSFNEAFKGMISLKSERELEGRKSTLLRKMALMWKRHNKTVKVQSEGDKTATVIVEDDPKPPDHSLIMIEEEGGWGVDLVETYAKWNHWGSAENARAIYKLTGAVLEALPRDASFAHAQCESNLKQLGLGLLMYTQDYDERYSLAKNWVDSVKPYIRSESLFHCPALGKAPQYGYAFNSKLSSKSNANVFGAGVNNPNRKPIISDSAKTVLIYETSVLKRNAYGMGEDLAFRHEGEAEYLFADGHVKLYPQTAKPSFNLIQ